jgi:hypothetical protein
VVVEPTITSALAPDGAGPDRETAVQTPDTSAYQLPAWTPTAPPAPLTFPPAPVPLPPPVFEPGAAPLPANRRRRSAGGTPWAVQGRRSRRVVRRIDTWTVLKLSLVFYLCVVLVLLIAGVILWNVASAFNVITNVEKFIRQLFDLQTFKLRPWVILEYSALGGLVLVVLGTGINVLLTLLYNLISDVIGGVQVIVLDDQESRDVV